MNFTQHAMSVKLINEFLAMKPVDPKWMKDNYLSAIYFGAVGSYPLRLFHREKLIWEKDNLSVHELEAAMQYRSDGSKIKPGPDYAHKITTEFSPLSEIKRLEDE